MIAKARWDSMGIIAAHSHAHRDRVGNESFATLKPSPTRTTDFETRMANIKSQIKRNRQNERRRMRNKVARSELKTRVKRAAEGVETGADDAVDRVRAAQKRLGKAAEKGVVHRNQAARRTSRLMKRAATKS
jgi:small subunit ribosomal protein S20